MSKDTVSKIGSFISDNKKPLLYIGGAVVVVIIGYALVSKVTKGISTVFTDKSAGASNFLPISIDESKATISDSTANTYANQLWGAMNTVGTDSNLIYNIVGKLQKKDDFLKVYNAFGRKSYVGVILGGSPNAADKLAGNYDDLDLIQWFNKEIGWANPITYSLIRKTVENAGLTI
jgi:hypothetical protein